MKKEQELMLEILINTKKILEKENIKYWLDAGTLLGAVRHKGFIPWDDDIDIAILEEDFEKAKNKLKEELNERFIVDEKFYKEFNYLKVKYKNKYLLGKDNEKINIFIDIFPFCYYKKRTNKIDNILIKLYSYNIFSETLLKKKNLNIKKIIIYISKKLPNKYIEKILKRKIKEEGNYIGYSILTGFTGQVKKRDVFPLRKIKFEKYNFSCPKNYHEYLKAYYGNYMRIPEESKRYTHSAGYEGIDKENNKN